MTQANRTVLIISVTSLIWLFAYKLYFLFKPEIFPNASQTGDIIFSIATSIVASGIFYFFNVYLPNRTMSLFLFPLLNERLQTFGTSSTMIILSLYQARGLPAPNMTTINQTELIRICEATNLYEQPPAVGGTVGFIPKTWFEFFDYFFQSDKAVSDILYKHVSFLSPRILRELDKIAYSNLQRALDSYRINGNFYLLSGASNVLLNYLESQRLLGSYTV